MKRLLTDHRGLTLLELLVAVSVFSLIGAALASVLSVGIQLKRRTDRHEAQMQIAGLVLNDISRNLRNVVQEQARSFRGAPDRITFGARDTRWQDGRRAAILVHRLTYEDNAGRILRTSPDPIGKTPVPRVLTDEGAELRFLYHAGGGDLDARGWKPDWSGEGPPEAVRIELTFPEKATSVPEIVWRRAVHIPLSTLDREVDRITHAAANQGTS